MAKIDEVTPGRSLPVSVISSVFGASSSIGDEAIRAGRPLRDLSVIDPPRDPEHGGRVSRRERATPTRVAGLALVCLLAAGCTAGPDTSPTSPSPAPPAASTAPQSEEPASAPVLGGFHVLVPDPAGEGVLLLNGPPDGGHDDGPMALWRWDGSAWESVPVDGEAPDARSFFAAAYDDRRDVVVLHGGETVAGASGETWEWDGRQWHGFGDDGPGARGASAMVFDPATGQSVLYGGSAASGEITNDTWSWDGRRWSRLATDGRCLPAGRRQRWPTPRRSPSCSTAGTRSTTAGLAPWRTPGSGRTAVGWRRRRPDPAHG